MAGRIVLCRGQDSSVSRAVVWALKILICSWCLGPRNICFNLNLSINGNIKTILYIYQLTRTDSLGTTKIKKKGKPDIKNSIVIINHLSSVSMFTQNGRRRYRVVKDNHVSKVQIYLKGKV